MENNISPLNIKNFNFNLIKKDNVKEIRFKKDKNLKEAFISYLPEMSEIIIASPTDMVRLYKDQTVVTSMKELFYYYRSLENISGLSHIDVSHIKCMEELFHGCSSLKDISPLKNWNTNNLEDISYIFLDCKLIEDISPLENWNLSNILCADRIFNNDKLKSNFMRCPKKGSFIAYKYACAETNHYSVNSEYTIAGGAIIKLEIPKDAHRSSSFGIKCRCSCAKVLEINPIEIEHNIETITKMNINKNIKLESAHSEYRNTFEYIIGKEVYSDEFDFIRWNECSNGIHFFMSEDDTLKFLKFQLEKSLKEHYQSLLQNYNRKHANLSSSTKTIEV